MQGSCTKEDKGKQDHQSEVAAEESNFLVKVLLVQYWTEYFRATTLFLARLFRRPGFPANSETVFIHQRSKRYYTVTNNNHD